MDKITGTDYMINLARDLQAERQKPDGTKKPGLAESSAVSYIKNLYNLNDKKPFKSLAFLRNTEGIDNKISGYSDNTKKTLLGIIVGTLMATKFRSKKVIDHYRVQLDGNAKTLRELEGKNEKTEKQERNWISSEDVSKMKEERLKTLNEKLGNKAKITPALFDELLAYLLVSLYTDTSPRRNQDYMKMVIVKKWNDKMPKDVNYLDLAGDRFVFNVYKTARKYGQHIVNIPAELRTTLTKYLKYHPDKGGKWLNNPNFLVTGTGKVLAAGNAITRILNKWFGKNVGSSLLRHIYLSGKYGEVLQEQKQDSLDMGHSLNEQRNYLKVE